MSLYPGMGAAAQSQQYTMAPQTQQAEQPTTGTWPSGQNQQQQQFPTGQNVYGQGMQRADYALPGSSPNYNIATGPRGGSSLYPGGGGGSDLYTPGPNGQQQPPADQGWTTTAWVVGGVALIAAAGLGYWLWTSQKKGG